MTDKVHTVYVRHNYYAGKHYNNAGRAYPVLAKSPEEAESIAKTHKDKIENNLRTLKVRSGSATRNLIAKSDKYRLNDKDIHAEKLHPHKMFQDTHPSVIDRNGNFPNKKVNEMADQTVTLIDAISSGDTIASAQLFNDALMSRVSDLIDDRRQEVAQNIFEAHRVRDNIELGGKLHPKNRVPIEHHAEFLKSNPGATVRFRGPRHDAYTTLKSDATHFNIVRTKDQK